eukprot:TRINITY_DN6290_c0_g1_i2.p1 TRINITY_DN6290_c0_g1~~TRINITY_DN6290_c0_g1_i2.p1  ORF type:complete len:252 (-),score=45.11 TRINITY_DN6290_c0_g1_i2:17-772(-)
MGSLRRGVGIQALDRQKLAQKQFQQVGSDIAAEQIKLMNEQLLIFKDNLEEFAKKYKKDINKDPEFRKYFQDMCQKIGVDPLASHKGFWAQLLGVGDFYYELGVQIVEVCLRTRPSNGGLIEMHDLVTRLQAMRGRNAQTISEDDIERSIKRLKVLGQGFNLLMIGSLKMVQSVPCELNNDHTTVLLLSQNNGGKVSAEYVIKELGWTKTRTDTVLNLLLKEGMAWLDNQSNDGEVLFWFPTLSGINLDDN